jgi:hypothetical protein
MFEGHGGDRTERAFFDAEGRVLAGIAAATQVTPLRADHMIGAISPVGGVLLQLCALTRSSRRFDSA